MGKGAGRVQKGFVVQTIPEPAIRALRSLGDVTVFDHQDRPISHQELRDAVADCTYIFALGGVLIDGEVLNRAPHCSVIGVMEIFPTGVDVQAATERGIPVTGLPNLPIISESTAELAVALMLTVARRIPEAAHHLRQGRWRQYQSTAIVGTMVYEKTLGIVGLGSVGQRIASRAVALGMKVVYTDTRPLPARQEEGLGVARLPLESLLRSADFVILATTLTPNTRGLIDRQALSLMKPTAYLINASRGAVIVEEDLISALAQKRIAGAALDVFTREPPKSGGGPNARLLELDNVHLTPHLGTAALEARKEMALHVASDIAAVLSGKRPSRLLNPELYGEPPLEQDRIG